MSGFGSRIGSRKVTAWLASFAILLSSLGPAFGAVRHAHEGHWSRICSAGETRLIYEADVPSPASGGSDTLSRDECPCCLMKVELALPGAQYAGWIVVLDGRRRAAPLHADAPLALAWASARPRAPPAYAV